VARVHDEPDDPVVRFLSVTESACPPDGHLDDDTLTLLELGAASAEERERVREHIADCPPCRRLVSLALASGAAARRRPILLLLRWTPARILAVAVAASLLVGLTLWLAVDRLRPIRVEGLAVVAVANGQVRGQGDGRARSAWIRIDPPRDGVAAVVRVAPGAPKPTPRDLPVRAGVPAEYGPLNVEEPETSWLVIITERSAHREIEAALAGLQGGPGPIKPWEDRLARDLKRSGHRWVAFGSVKAPATNDGAAGPPKS
jgi:hypothetical protein